MVFFSIFGIISPQDLVFISKNIEIIHITEYCTKQLKFIYSLAATSDLFSQYMKSKNFQCGLYEPDIDLICEDSLKKMEIAIIVNIRKNI